MEDLELRAINAGNEYISGMGDKAEIIDRFVTKVFKAEYSYALPVEKINRIIFASTEWKIEEVHIRGALRRAVRGKFLRSRMSGGERLWEVNYYGK